MFFLIVGTPRSGTTLVQRLACELPDVAMSPETHFFSSGFAGDLVRRGGFPLGGQRLDRELTAYERAFRSWTGNRLPLDETAVEALLGGSCDDAVRLFAAVVRSLAGPGSILGEKTPDHLAWWRPISRAMSEARFVFVVRDPRAVVESNMRMPWGAGTSHVALAERWRADARTTRAAMRTLDGRCLLLRYEDVTRDPDGCRENIRAHLGVSGLGGARIDGEQPGPFVLPWESWKERALGPVASDRADAWRDALDPEASVEVSVICRAEMHRFGYEPEVGAVGALRRRLTMRPDQRRKSRHMRRRLERRQREIDAVDLTGESR